MGTDHHGAAGRHRGARQPHLEQRGAGHVDDLPAIRSELAKSLLSLGMKQKDVSELMDITQPAVSQYITDKRGSGIKFNDEVNSLINDFASELYSGEAKKSDIISKTCFICKQIKTSDIIEQLNIDKSELGDDCKACIDSENL